MKHLNKKLIAFLIIYLTTINCVFSADPTDPFRKCPPSAPCPTTPSWAPIAGAIAGAIVAPITTVIAHRVFSKSPDESQILEEQRIKNMSSTGHECISYEDSKPPKCFPYLLSIESAIYGDDSERAKYNLMERCEAMHSCRFDVSNDFLGLDNNTGKVVDPKPGTPKSLQIRYRCILPVKGTPFDEHPVELVYKEKTAGVLNCSDYRFRTIYRKAIEK